ncbi:MAG: response regulator [Bacteroidia bacterium]|nr:response regulator [Bacteroidia bacterium]
MSKNILIIEDEFFISMILKDTVTRFGYNVVDIVRYGEKVIESIEKSNPKPDLILADIYLPGPMSGIDAARLINEKYDIPIIFITAYSDRATKAKADEVDHAAFLSKPYHDGELKRVIQEALGSKTLNQLKTNRKI